MSNTGVHLFDLGSTEFQSERPPVQFQGPFS